MQVKELRKFIDIINENSDPYVGDPITYNKRQLRLDMPTYEFYRLGLKLASKDTENTLMTRKHNDNDIVCYSDQEFEDLKNLLKKLGIKYEEPS